MPHRSGLILLAAVACGAQEGPLLFTPTDKSVVAPGSLRVIGKASMAQLTLDGKAVPVTSPAAGVIHAELKLSPGPHELILKGAGGEARSVFFVGKEHQDWKMFRAHPPAAPGCDTCHAVKDGEWALKRATLSPICHTCHDKARFPATHTHNTDILTDCQNCHHPHGSAVKGHLKQPKEVVCKQCHS
ncbi:MAG TPA: cytochrome c3 family protein [Bryobacteraceae bacterium]|nr:cytochrome c3 family protein [Bryobacteraceae bacterium]